MFYLSSNETPRVPLKNEDTKCYGVFLIKVYETKWLAMICIDWLFCTYNSNITYIVAFLWEQFAKTAFWAIASLCLSITTTKEEGF